MNFNNEKLKYIVFSLLAVATLLLIYLEAKADDFKVQTLRQMWQACYLTSMRVEPQFPPQYHAMMCDCMIDKGRQLYVNEQDYDQSSDNKSEMWEGFSTDCRFEVLNSKPI